MKQISGFKNSMILTEEGIKKTNLIIKNGLIQEIGSNEVSEMIELKDELFVIPGLIDEHIHGANGYDVIDGDVEGLYQISKALAKEGVTGYLATTTTQKREIILNALKAVKEYKDKNIIEGAEIIGVHLEGPFISDKYAGAQLKNYILKPDVKKFLEFIKYQNEIKLVTLAIEEDFNNELINYLKANNIVVSIGHSNATYLDIKRSITGGVTCITHTYNGMKPFNKDEIGVVGSALLCDELYCELICDGIHLSIPAIKLLCKNKPKDKIILITDALRMKNMPDGKYYELEQTITLNNKSATLKDGTLAGSVLKMNEAIKNIINYTECDFITAIKYATENPTKNLGVFDKMGSIKVNKLANLTVIDKEFNIYLTIRNGFIIYDNIKEKSL